MHASKGDALQATAHDLELLAAKFSQAVQALLHEAHTTMNSQPHHIQALTFSGKSTAWVRSYSRFHALQKTVTGLKLKQKPQTQTDDRK